MKTKDKMKRSDWYKTEKHLPPFLRDFHDQKDFFKTFHYYFGEGMSEVKESDMPTWVSGQIYTIDFLLRFLAAHGWTLQKCRANVDFCDIDESIGEFKKQTAEVLRKILFEGRDKQ